MISIYEILGKVFATIILFIIIFASIMILFIISGEYIDEDTIKGFLILFFLGSILALSIYIVWF